MSDGQKGSLGSGHHEENAGVAPRKGGFKGHCKRFWWIHLLVAIIVLVVVLVLVIFVGVPKIAQQKIDAAQLSIQGISALQTRSQEFQMSINSTITTDGSVHAVVDAFEGAMYLEDLEGHRPFATLKFPETTSEASQIVNVSQHVPITDMEAFTTFNTWLLSNTSLRVTVEGDTNVHVRGLNKAYPVHFKKTVEMPGLSHFDGTTVFGVDVTILPGPDGNNMHGKTTIPNRSLVTFEIGNATFHNYLLGEEVGTVFINNMILRPGDNTFDMAANVSQLPVLKAIGERPYCQNGILPFQLRGKTVVNLGQPLSYFADALAASNQTVEINLTDALTALKLAPKCA